MFKKNILILVLVVLSICVYGNTAWSAASTKGFICYFKNGVNFITWTEDNSNNIVGQLQETYLTDSGIMSKNHAINGIINSPNISITISGSIWTDKASGTVFTGTLDVNSNLTLLYPNSDGTIASVHFESGDVNDFNTAVESLTNIYTSKQNTEKRQKIVKSLSVACNTLRSITINDVGLNIQYIEIMKKHYLIMQADYNKLLKDASVRPLTYQRLNGLVYQDLNSKIYQDLNSTLYQDVNGTIYQYTNNLKSVIFKIQSHIDDVQAAYLAYKNNGINGSFTDESIAELITKARNNMKILTDKVTTTQQQADNIYKQGEQLYQTAQRYYNSLTSSN